MLTIKNCRLSVLALILGIFLCGCASMPPAFADKDLLAFLTEGVSKESVLLKLGEPSATFEQGRILTYRLGADEQTGYFLLDRQYRWESTKYSLVIVFDDKGVLKKHSLVHIR